MAVIPQVQISTRQVESSPNLHYFPSTAGENGRVLGGAISSVGSGLDRIMEVQRRADEREAEYAVMQADNFVRNGWVGVDSQDPQTGAVKHIPGVADQTWQQMRDAKTTATGEMRGILNSVRQQEFYANLSPYQRKVFERKWMFKADEFNRVAHQHSQRLTATRAKEETLTILGERGREVGMVYGADDATYTRVADRNSLLNWGTVQGTNLNEQSRQMLEDPRCTFDDIVKSQGWDEETVKYKRYELEEIRRKFDVNRITAFQQAARTGQSLGGNNAERCADIADVLTDKMFKEGFASEEQANAIRAETASARRSGEMVISKRHHDNMVREDAELDKLLWKMAPGGEDGNAVPNSALSVQLPDENAYRAVLQRKIDAGELSESNALSLMRRLTKMHEDQREVFEDASHPEKFAKKSDQYVWLNLKQCIANRKREGTSVETLERAVDGAKEFLTQKDYFSLWDDVRKKRDDEDDRITTNVFASFLKIDEYTAGIALDPKKRRTSAGEDAVSTLLGSSEAEYERKGRMYNPDFTIEDVDAACREVRQYLREHPGDEEGAYQYLETLVRPKSDKARATAFRDRITQMIKRRAGQTGTNRIWNVDQAFDSQK